MAFATSDGQKLWTFDTIPTGNEAGADTWASPDTALTGGGSWWTSATLDPKTGTVFFPVGNPAPDYAPDYRPGANLYTDSVLALDAATGALRWYYQLVAHDQHDWDTTDPPMSFTAKDGTAMYAFAGKNGYLTLLNATSHALLHKLPVTTISNVDAPFTPEGTHYCPNQGVQWNGPAYSSREKLVFVSSVDWCSIIKSGVAHFEKGVQFLGSANGSGVRDADRTGWLYAIDPVSGHTIWRYHAGGPMVAGITVTAGGVLFTGEYTGLFDAFDASSGKMLYQFQTGAPMAGGVITYAVDGRQFVAAVSGNHSIAALGGDGAGMVYVFSLGTQTSAPSTPK
jgi:alcohol dehydrogenase (cytochrome c)